MAKLADTIALKGQSRSAFCATAIEGARSACHRLAGHKGDHRPTLKGRKVKIVAPVEVLSADKYTVLPAADEPRRVAAPGKRAKKRNSGQPSVPKASPTRSTIG